MEITKQKRQLVSSYLTSEAFNRGLIRYNANGNYAGTQPFTNALNDKSVISADATSCVSSPSSYTFEAGKDVATPTYSQFTGLDGLGHKVLACALMYLITKTTSYRDAVVTVITTNLAYNRFDFSDTGFWTSITNAQLDNGFWVGEYMSAMAEVYQIMIYCETNFRETIFSSAQKNQFEKNLYYYANYVMDRHYVEYAKEVFIQPNPTPSSSTSAVNLDISGVGYSNYNTTTTSIFYPTTIVSTQINTFFSNRISTYLFAAANCILTFYITGCKNLTVTELGLTETTFQNALHKYITIAKNHYKQSLKFGFFPFTSNLLGNVTISNELYRGVSDVARTQGVQYAQTTVTDMFGFAFRLHNVKTDWELLTYSTSDGIGSSIGSKSVRGMMLGLCHFLGNNTPYCYYDAVTQTDTTKYQTLHTNGTNDYHAQVLALYISLFPDEIFKNHYKRNTTIYPNMYPLRAAQIGFASKSGSYGAGASPLIGINLFYGID